MDAQVWEWRVATGEHPRQEGEQQLIERCRAGDMEAFGVLWQQHRTAVFRSILGIVGNPQDAEDLTQDAFLRAYRALDSFRGEAQLRTWLVRIGVHLAIDHVKRKKAHPEVSLDWDVGGGYADIDPHAAAERNELRETVRKAIDALPPHHRAVIVLRDMEGMDYAEMAQALGCSVGSVKLRLFRARRLLKQRLEVLLGGSR